MLFEVNSVGTDLRKRCGEAAAFAASSDAAVSKPSIAFHGRLLLFLAIVQQRRSIRSTRARLAQELDLRENEGDGGGGFSGAATKLLRCTY